MSAVEGTCAPGFERLRDLLAARLDSGDDLGASVCVIKDGETAVDLWGGVADERSGRRWERDTLVNTYSLTKTMSALVVLSLVDKGLIDPDERVATYWPEFAAAGKQGVLVRHVLGHASGLPAWRDDLTLTDLYDTERTAALLAAQEPWFAPGEGSGYQAVSHGPMLGEIVRRVTGRTLGTILREEFAEPLGADYWLGAPPHVDARLATLVPPPRGSSVDYSALSELTIRTLTNPAIPTRAMKDREYLAAELCAFNGQGNARSVATLQSIVSHGGVVAGRRYLSPEAIERIFDVQSDGPDRVLGAHLRFGLGYALAGPGNIPSLRSGRVCWWTGYGGSYVVNDLDHRMTVAYTMNKMDPSFVNAPNGTAYVEATYACL